MGKGKKSPLAAVCSFTAEVNVHLGLGEHEKRVYLSFAPAGSLHAARPVPAAYSSLCPEIIMTNAGS